MKKFIAIASMAGLMAVSSWAQNIPSVNAAGYIKITVEPGRFSFVQNPFVKFDGNDYTVEELFGDSVPFDTTVYKWNGLTFETATYTARGGGTWLPAGKMLVRGEGFFIQVPGDAPEPSYEVFVFGEVPGAVTFGTTTTDLIEGFTALGFPYPVETTVTAMGLDNPAERENGDTIYLWDSTLGELGQYSTYTWIRNSFFSPAPPAIAPGQPFFFEKKSTGVAQIQFDAPYTWPGN